MIKDFIVKANTMEIDLERLTPEDILYSQNIELKGTATVDFFIELLQLLGRHNPQLQEKLDQENAALAELIKRQNDPGQST